MKRIAIILPALVMLAACGDKHLEIARPPVDKLVCPDEPGAPEATGSNGRVTDEAAGAYMRKLRGSWQGCRADVDWLRDWFGKLPK